MTRTLIRDGVIGGIVALLVGLGLGILIGRRRKTAVAAA